MVNWWHKALVVVPTACGLALSGAGGAIAQTVGIDPNSFASFDSNDPDVEAMNQVNSVFQLRDVSPGDWAFEALRNLVERYGCIAGYPDGTFRGNRRITRYEFAAGLNACLQAIERIIVSGDPTGGTTRGTVDRSDINTLERLVQEFNAELAVLGTQIDNLEGRVTGIEESQFSTTTKLNGAIIFDITTAFSGDDTDLNVEEQTAFQHRTRLAFDTSFTGQDRLRTRLQAANFEFLGSTAGTDMAARNLSGDTGNVFSLNDLVYRFQAGDNLTLYIATQGLLIDDVFDAASTASFAYNSLSLFVAYNNLVYDVSNAGGAGVGANITLSDTLQFDLGYFVPSGIAANPDDGNGIFNGNFSAGAQLGYSGSNVALALAYMYNYHTGDSGYDISGFVGSDNAQDPFGAEANTAHAVGLSALFSFGPSFNLGGYAGATFAESEVNEDDSADLFNWLAFVEFPDLGKEGGVLILGFGQPPKVTSADGSVRDDDQIGTDDTSYLLSVEYFYPVGENIVITPGGYAIFNPEHNDNDTLYIGTIRTEFYF